MDNTPSDNDTEPNNGHPQRFNGNDSSSGSSLGEPSDIDSITSDVYVDGLPDSINGTTTFKGIKILSWNVNSAIARRESILYAINTKSYDVVLIQESRLTDKNHFNIHIPGYKKYLKFADKDRNNAGGLATFIKEEIASVKIDHPSYGDKFEHLCVKIKTKEGIIEVQNIYWPNNIPNPRQISLGKSSRDIDKLIIAGDFNAHQNGLIRKNTANNNIAALDRILESTNLVLTNPRIPTTTNGTIIDLCITSNNLCSVTDTIITDHLSDIHYALEIDVNVTKFLTEEDFTPRLKFESADWELFMKKLDENFEEENIIDNISPENLDEAAIKMAEIYYDTANQVIPKTKYNSKPWQSWYWCPEVCRATRKANYWRKAHKKPIVIPNLRYHKRNAIQEEADTIRQAKQKAWNKLCNDIILTDNNKKAWNRIKNLRRGGLPPNKTKVLNPADKAEQLAASFAQRTQTMNLTTRIRNTMALLEPARLQAINVALNTPDPEFDKDITDWEINKAFDKGKDSAPGDDKITYSMVKNSGPIARSVANKIYNTSWRISKIPTHWKIASQVAIPKPAVKDEFRPISLLSVFDKNIERIVHDRMMQKTRSKLHKNLYGFLENRGTQDGLLSLSNTASKHIFDTTSCGHMSRRTPRNRNNRCIAVFVDLEKAFELANKNVILNALAKLGVKGKLLAWIQNYLSDRKGYVTMEGHKSSTHNFENGTPQGSIISPALFNILMHELLSYTWPDNVEVYSYADDLVIITRDINAVQKIKQSLNILSRACEELGLKINARKTKVMEFTSGRHRDLVDAFKVGIGEDEATLEVVSEFKYLGVIYTSNMKGAKHITYAIGKANRKINILKAMACKEYGCDTATLVKYASTCIRPILEYGSLVLNAAGITKTAKAKFESVMPRALKIAYGLPNSTRNHAVLSEAGLTNMAARIEQASMCSLAKVIRSYDNHPAQVETINIASECIEFHNQFQMYPVQKRLDELASSGHSTLLTWNHQPWIQRTIIQLISNLTIWDMLSSKNRYSSFKVPVGAPHKHKTQIAIFPLATKKDSLSEEEKLETKTQFSNIITEMERDSQITIYTDASVNQEKHLATFACVTYLNGILSEPLSTQGRISDHSGSMTAELHAIKHAIKIVSHNALRLNIKKFLIVTDSMSGLQALYNTKNPDNRLCVQDIHLKLEVLHNKAQASGILLWCPSHIGIPGNELADVRAGRAMEANLPMTNTPAATSAIKSQIKKSCTEKWLRNRQVSTFYEQVNLDVRKYRIPKAPRSTQIRIMKLRHNTEKLCRLRCRNLCERCDAPFSTGHYLISCPATMNKDNIRALLNPEEHSFEEDIQAAIILHRISNTDHRILLDIINKRPPASYCPDHPRILSKKFYPLP